MTASVLVACSDCGESRLHPSQLRLFTTPSMWASRYAFTCPQCQAWINKPVPPHLLHALRQDGVPEQRVRVPREVFERHAGPPVSVDEVLDFALEVAGVDDLARFACRR